jgi:hypothetical protein
MKPAGFRLAAPRTFLALAAAFAAGSCTEINGAADHVAALEFSRLPYPSIVSGDTLRDSLGVASPLKAVFFNGNGEEIESDDVSFIALDTGLTISSTGLVTTQRRSGQVPIVASTSVLQTRAVNLIIARRPDSALISLNARDTIDFEQFNPASTNNNSGELSVRVLTADSAGGITTTQGWLVSFQASFRGAVVPPGDTSSVFLLGDGNQRSNVDTTNSSGIASRRLRLNLIGVPPFDLDSAFVTATVRHKGQHVRGSPLRFVILLRKKP